MRKLMIGSIALLFVCSGLFLSCVSPDIQSQLEKISQRQDSILSVLRKIDGKNDYVAKRMGWEPPEDTLPKEIPLGQSYYQGAKDPVLTIVEFTDLQCPYCARIAPLLDSLVKTYPNKIRVVFKHFPLSFHKQAREAHAATIAAGKQGRFFDYRYRLASEYRTLADTTYIKIAEEIGLDVEEFKTQMKLTPDANRIIDADVQLGQKLFVRGTPTLFANGKKVQDRSFNGFVKLMKANGG
ncbi:MAG: thioredoxin domain-containing protein [Fibrobacteria bacterium]|nr:thioredoxin domain-containing protein [Fibrobacteria bacterium]